MAMAALYALLFFNSLVFSWACETGAWSGFDQEAYAGSLWGGSIGGIVVGLLMIILVSLPLCCGVMKKQGKVIGAIGIVLGLLSLIIPYFGAMGSCAPFMDAACANRCTGFECTQYDKDVALSACQALGVIFVYLGVFGWLACVLGIVAASMACCVCCQCCNAKLDTEVIAVQQTPVVPIVVGQPP
ncbi:unnamed protein product [Cladocopium goreaui]|uniref:S-formylglutathione hydrolase n=1 Tax=Cladocopium goreaui TaxID=2562237 RepID=A0A9P1CN04_9DINO|nr:unnamed protein product [Cladocopium goreaui]